jgi:hypothetical protein
LNGTVITQVSRSCQLDLCEERIFVQQGRKKIFKDEVTPLKIADEGYKLKQSIKIS